MSPWIKFLIGLAAALLAGWISHGPLGRGEAFLTQLEQHAQRRLQVVNVAGVTVRMERDPLGRTAILSGRTDAFQREGMGSYPGINDRIRTIPGIRGLRWEGS
jgi:hypothetical protein